MGRLIIVSNRLPCKVSYDKEHSLRYVRSEGGVASGLDAIYQQGENLWIGWPGLFVQQEKARASIRAALRERYIVPVFLSKADIEDYYHGFSNETLWPIFHGFTQYSVHKERFWQGYKRVQRKFAEVILALARPDDTLWIHDYQLLLLPEMLRKRLPKASIGFFLHIPFPPLHSYRQLPWRSMLLRGMLGADLLAFHTFDDTRHFFSALYRLLGIVHTQNKFIIQGRVALAETMPMGIDYDKYAELASRKDVVALERHYRASFGDKRLILSVDRLDYSKGILQRLRAFELFLSRHSGYQGKLSLVLVVVPSREEVSHYRILKREIDLLVGQINGQYARLEWTPIHYFYRSLAPSLLSAFYRMSDIALVTPMIDGMNLVCKEYIASHAEKRGVLILSETAGSAKELYEALIVNPYDTESIVRALSQALKMSKKEQRRRMEAMQRSLRLYSVHHWSHLFLKRLKEVKVEQEQLRTRQLDSKLRTDLEKAYEKASRRLILLDYDGTLMPFSSHPRLSAPDEGLRRLLESLEAAASNEVVIISGRGKDAIEKWLGGLPIGLVAEHGAWIRMKGGRWRSLISAQGRSWKEEVRGILDEFVTRTPASFIEEKDFSLVWHFRKVEHGFGELRAWELINHLRYVLSDMGLSVLEGNKVVEIKNPEVDKGRASKLWLERYKPDFIMAIGDDITDEDTFAQMPSQAYTIKVGDGSSQARYGLSDVRAVRTLLSILVALSVQESPAYPS